MSPRIVVIAAVVATGVIAWSLRSRADQPTSNLEPIHARPSPSVGKVQGIGGCAAAGCHNAPGQPGTPGTEYATWIHDPHGRAAETLNKKEYKEILRKLRGTPYTEELCLKCHATPTADGSPLVKDLLADGIGCESCHGPAEKWRTIHYQSWWKGLKDSDKQTYGMYPTKNLEARIAKCAECHVGNETKDVNHDLIAAGHPRLNFEFSAYHHLMKPRHWLEPHEKSNAPSDWEAQAWATGQAVTAKAAAELLETRAKHAGEPTHPWPEYSEYGCYACHHDLKTKNDAWRRSRQYMGLPVGSLPWGTWTLPALELHALASGDSDASTATRSLVSLMARSYPPPMQTAASARKLADMLALSKPTTPFSAERLRASLKHLANDAGKPDRFPDWESAAQYYLGIAALYHALGDLSPIDRTEARTEAILKLREPLKFPAKGDSPRDFKPDQFRDRLRSLQPLFKE